MKKLITILDDQELDLEISGEKVIVDENILEIKESIHGGYEVSVDDEIIEVDDVIDLEDEGIYRVEIGGYTLDVKVEDPVAQALSADSTSDGSVISPMAGEISNIHVKEGQKIEEGELVLVISAMKMENKILAPVTGVVESIKVKNDDNVTNGELLVIIEPKEEQ